MDDEISFTKSLERLKDEAMHERNGASRAIVMEWIMMREGVVGDPSFLRSTANKLCRKVVNGEALSANERYYLSVILGRLSDSQPAAIALSGKPKKGAPRKGKRSMDLASAVVIAIMDHGATTIEEAQELVAGKAHVDVSTVKKSWRDWRPTFQALMSESFSDDGLVRGFDDALKDMQRTNAGK